MEAAKIKVTEHPVGSPGFVAGIANSVYAVRTPMDARVVFEQYGLNTEVGGSLKAKTGFRLVNKSTAFALCARGSGKEYSKQLFVIFRGTEPAKHYGADIVTDLRAGVVVSSTGKFVHSGFNNTFESVKEDLRAFIRSQKDWKTINFIGHSLGGAIAQLAAEWCSATFSGKAVKVYTFGSPRVGCGVQSFPTSITVNVKPQNIYRVLHSSDPVPMVPCYPYEHAPTTGHPYYIHWCGSSISIAAHSMVHYISSVSSMSDWSNHVAQEPPVSCIRVKEWLKSDTLEPVSSLSLWLKLNSAIRFIGQLLGARFQPVYIVGATILDHLAVMVEKGLEISSEASPWTFAFFKKLMMIAGFPVVKSLADITIGLIRSVLERTLRILYRFVRQAMAQIG